MSRNENILFLSFFLALKKGVPAGDQKKNLFIDQKYRLQYS